MSLVKFQVNKQKVAKVILNRPEKKNAFSAEMITELERIANEISKAPNIRVVSLIAEGSLFCSGADLEWMRTQLTNSPEDQETEVRKLASMLKAWYDIPYPIVIKVQGGAFGGALGLMAIGDEVITEGDAKFSFSEVKLGLIPATISPYIYATTGPKKAKKYLFSGKIFDAEIAKGLNLVDEICSRESLDDSDQKAIEKYLKAAPRAVIKTKALFRSYGFQITDEIIETSRENLTLTWRDQEAKEGIVAFFEKSKPTWLRNI